MIFFTCITSIILAVFPTENEPATPKEVACHCPTCKCSDEDHCGCISNEGCHCDKDCSCMGRSVVRK